MSNVTTDPAFAPNDINGQPLVVGSICIVLTGGEPDDIVRKGAAVIVRSISPARLDKTNTFQAGPRKGQPKPGFPKTTTQVRVDDATDAPDDAKTWHFSAWMDGNDLLRVSAPVATANEPTKSLVLAQGPGPLFGGGSK